MVSLTAAIGSIFYKKKKAKKNSRTKSPPGKADDLHTLTNGMAETHRE